MLNLSVDAPNPEVINTTSRLPFNDQESIIEMVVEQLLGFHNGIVEFDDHDTSHEQRQKKNLGLDVYVLSEFNALMEMNMHQNEQQQFGFFTLHFDTLHSAIHSPPPEV